MQLMPEGAYYVGDYYVWYCDWCDTRNMTVWTRIEQNLLCCSACHKKVHAHPETHPSPRRGPTAHFG